MAQNTPIIKPSRIMKAARYCIGFFSITVQPAMTTSGVMNVVSNTSGTAMPSTPR